MTVHNENDVIHLREPVNADVIGEKRSLLIPSGTAGAIVLVHGDSLQPLAYEVEFYISDQDCYALATIEAEKI
jgi:hypothetical protein